ncbi:S41 family peptidase [Paramaledivibacter caminithermalis]|jgi:carboxyl-terminal processing protease|uniref:Carboxyl-terminal processing protease n=1 Tax=Paramaledivibacter caminithermalis (strain DSM 15212 / CIP 107654 / DViRD3) TaxID=1121301 RepID=A0A1M6KFH3_PARC5|nr:S41 family peptidase [Paramaledivibacter caminithermalis]SHJ57725.1 carboxyl-terminal processing protease [Paramaledivibacter caminithermalis DSM 15212]
MFKTTRFKKLSIALILIVTMLSTGFSYAKEPKIEFESLKERLNYLGSMIKYIEKKYKDEVSEEELMKAAYKGLFDALDRHSTYFSPEEYEEFDIDSSGIYGGIGVVVGVRNEKVTIVSPIKGTPGDKAGLKPGDIIKYVDGVDVTDSNFERVVKLMRGEPDTKIRLGIIRGKNPEVIYFDITRDIIKVNPVEYEIIENNIGYIKITTFNENTNENFKKALDQLLAKDVKGFIIDLRNNPGGLLSEVIKSVDYFIEEDLPIVHIKYKGDKKDTYISRKKRIDKPLVVLVNEGSASASEIFAGAVQDTKSGIIIGTQTYGKGTVQDVISITNGGAIKLTIAEYLTSNERRIDGIGLTPDIVIKNVNEEDKGDISPFAPMIEDVIPALNDKGLNIYGAQQRLKYLGYNVEASGILDEKTLESIKKFQKAQGLDPRGSLDYETRNKLNERIVEVYYNGIEDLQLEKAIETILN